MLDYLKHGLALVATIALLSVVAIGTVLLWYTWVKFIFIEHLEATVICVAILLAYYLVSKIVHRDDDPHG